MLLRYSCAMALSDQWWESSPLLTTISTVAGVLAVLASIWAALYASRPQRALAYKARWDPVTKELSQWISSVLPDEDLLSVAIVTFVLRGSGRLDVSSSTYDNAIPITLSVMDAEIHSLRRCGARGGGGLVPTSQVRDNKLEIGPGLIGRNQVLTYTLAVVRKNRSISSDPMAPSGRAPVTLANALIDTKVRTDKTDFLIRLTVIVLAAAFIFGIWYWWLRHTSLHINASREALLVALIPPIATAARSFYNNRRHIPAGVATDSVVREARITPRDPDKPADPNEPSNS